MSRLVLDIEIDYDFNLIGICAHLKDYRLAWELNRLLQIDLEKSASLIIGSEKNQRSFSMSSFIDEEEMLEYYLLKNKSDDGVLVPEESKCDFLLLLKGNLDDEDMSQLKKNILTVKGVLTTYKIDVDQLKSKSNLIF